MKGLHTRYTYSYATLGVLGSIIFGPVLSANADGTASYHVDLMTTALTGGIYTGPYMMDFQFIDGGGTGIEPNNTATISGFTYGGGTGPTSLISLNDGIVPGPGEVTVSFSPGTALDFNVSVTTNQDTGVGATPDSFSFALLDGEGNPIPTTDPGDAFFYITESGNSLDPTPLVQTFSAQDGRGGTFSPTITPQSASAPEPAAFLYALFTGGIGLALSRPLRLK